MITHEMKIRVWYKETDQMGFVHHSNYVAYYEAARSSFMRHLGVSYAEMEARGVMMPILDVQLKYHSPAFFEEELIVRLTVKEIPSTRFTAFYEIFNEKGKLINSGSTTLCFINSQSRRPGRAPEWFVDLLKSHWGECV